MDEHSPPPSPSAPPAKARKSFFANYSITWWIPVAILIALFRLKGSIACGSDVEPTPKLAPLTESEASDFGATLETALESCTPESIQEVFDMEALLTEAVRLSDVPKRVQQEVLAQMHRQVGAFDIGFCDPDDEYERARFMRLRERDGRQILLMRVWGAEGFDYLEFFAGKTADGRIVANDAYVYGVGSTLFNAFVEMIDALLESEVSTSQGQELQTAMAMIESDPEYALEVIDELPTKLRETRALQVQALHAASTLDLDTYASQLESYKKIFPNDPSATFLSLIVYTSNIETQMALATLDDIDQIVGGDRYLDQVRAEVLIADEDYPAALPLARSGLDAEPDDVMAYYVLFQALVWNRDFAGAVGILTVLSNRFADGYSEEEMLDMGDAFLEFMDSAEWQAFQSAE